MPALLSARVAASVTRTVNAAGRTPAVPAGGGSPPVLGVVTVPAKVSATRSSAVDLPTRWHAYPYSRVA
jgi:hypothetical protein